jgi:[methyl coenzyme M reductase]-L-arginine C-5-methyltransferase
LIELVELLPSLQVPIHIGYTSGKGFDSHETADALVDRNVREVDFSVFATDPRLRKRYMVDPSPAASLECLSTFCASCDVYAAAVIIPGINDGDILRRTCNDLERLGARSLFLMRLGNHPKEGLILGNTPIMRDIESQPIESFRELVTSINNDYKLRVTSALWDPEIGSPFYVASNPEAYLPRTEKRATVITGAAAEPYLRRYFSA